MWQWRHNCFSSKSNCSPNLHFLEKCLTVPILWVLVFCCAKFHKNLWGDFRDILEFLQKGHKSCMNWRSGVWNEVWEQEKKVLPLFVPTPKSKRLKQVTGSDLHEGPSSLLLSWKMVHFYHMESTTSLSRRGSLLRCMAKKSHSSSLKC